MILYIELVRHAESKANADNILQGHYDSPLTEKGKIQSKTLQDRLKGSYKAVYCSSLSRAMQTAEIALLEKPELYNDIVYLDELREIHLGDLQGIKMDEMTEEQKFQWQSIRAGEEFITHGGETRGQFGMRVLSAFDSIIKENREKMIDEILIFTHGGVIKALFQGRQPSIKPNIKNTSIFKFVINDDHWSLVS